MIILAPALALAAVGAPAPVTLRAADGVSVHALRYDAPRPRATVLLVHQAGSSKVEYAAIAPRLARMGFASLAIDQRSGGGLFGPNATAAGLRGPTTYLDAARDLEAAFAWGRAQGRPVILWGSSYSAALVFRLAARHPGQITALLAFSPGEYLDDKGAVSAAAAKVTAPIFVTSASTPDEIAAARAILRASPARVRSQFTPQQGVHGSSTLITARDPVGAAANWRAVTAFLDQVAPSR